MFIVGRLSTKGDLEHFNFPERKNQNCTINSLNFKSPQVKIYLMKQKRGTRSLGRVFIKFSRTRDASPFPIWTMEFGANYEFENFTPYFSLKEDLVGKRGVFGKRFLK